MIKAAITSDHSDRKKVHLTAKTFHRRIQKPGNQYKYYQAIDGEKWAQLAHAGTWYQVKELHYQIQSDEQDEESTDLNQA